MSEMFTEDAGAATTTPLDEAKRRRRGVQAALVELERAIAAPSTGTEDDWTLGVANQLSGLRDAWLHHVEVTEEPGGLFDEVMAQAPRLSHQVDHLRFDHGRLSEAIDATLGAATASDAAGQQSSISEASLDLLARLTRHRHLGSNMVYEAYVVDIDAAD